MKTYLSAMILITVMLIAGMADAQTTTCRPVELTDTIICTTTGR